VIPSSFKIYTSLGKLEPAICDNLDRFGFGYQRACDPRVKLTKGSNSTRTKIIKRDKADPNPSRLGKKVLHEFKHKTKLKATRGNLMNLLNLAKTQ
jgi:hypothetical protein